MNCAKKALVLRNQKLMLCGSFAQTNMFSLQQCRYQQTQEAKVLTSEFALKPFWKDRIQHMNKQGLQGSYEWITMVQKKYSGGGLASAIDLDVAVMLSRESDQIKDLIELAYRLRHTEHAGSSLPSTEYAFFRLLMKYEEWDQIFTLINDPINYGLFMNEHLSCWAMDQLLSKGNIQGAAKIATVAMQQEMFDFNLLNFMAIYSLLKWNELPSAERIFAANIHVLPEAEEEQNEEEVKTIKFPYLKNEWNDGHFDLLEVNALVGKSIEWFTRSLSEDQQLQAKLGESFKDMCESLISFGVSLQKAQSTCEQSNDEAEVDAETETEKEGSAVPEIPEKTTSEIPKDQSSEVPTAKMLHQMFAPILHEEEQKLINFQKKQFLEWNDTRYKFIEVQAERLELRLRLDEIAAQQKSLQDEYKVLFFFENRSKYEEEAIAKDKLLQGLDKEVKTKEELEREYATSIFETQRKAAEENLIPTIRK